MRQFLTMMVLAGALRGPAPAQQSLGLVQPDAGFVFGIEWRKIVASPIGGELTSQMKGQMGQQPEIQKMQDALMHDLDSVLIAAPASGMKKGGEKPPMLFVMSGHFKIDELRGLTKGQLKTSETYRAVELLVPPDEGSKDMRIAFLDSTTILGGDTVEVRAAIDRFKGARRAAVKGGIVDGIPNLASKNDLWMTVEIPDGALQEANPMAAQMFAGVNGAELGMSFEQGLGLLLNIRTTGAEAAGRVAQALQGLLAMGAMSQSDDPQAAELLKKLQVKSEDTRVTVGLVLDKADLDKMIEKFKANAAKPKQPKGSKI